MIQNIFYIFIFLWLFINSPKLNSEYKTKAEIEPLRKTIPVKTFSPLSRFYCQKVGIPGIL